LQREKNKDADELDLLSLAEQEQDLPTEIEDKRRKGLLRTGYTTGTCAAAATRASLLALISGKYVDNVAVSLPKDKTAQLKIAWTKVDEDNNCATSAVVKDGGDDPDVTHGAEICSTVSFTNQIGTIVIDGGTGVGKVTKPGLGLEIGRAAINPTPTNMIKKTIIDTAGEKLKHHGFNVIISVPKGEEIAKKTDNPRLGIVDGISILGTTGIVLPYSTASFAASISQSMDVAIAMGTDTVVLTTGGRSEDFAKEQFQQFLPEHSFIQMGDFAGFSIKQCTHKKIQRAIIAGFIGKLTKIAMGIKQTHVRGSHINMEFMAKVASECCLSHDIILDIRKANTARHVFEIIKRNNISEFFYLICQKVYEQMYNYSNGQLQLEVLMFDFDGRVCGRYPRS
jgi:cobalt-precorrin-5B (C1)-methyltransferase